MTFSIQRMVDKEVMVNFNIINADVYFKDEHKDISIQSKYADEDDNMYHTIELNGECICTLYNNVLVFLDHDYELILGMA